MGADPSDESTKLDAFRGALEKLGYIDGQTIVMARPPQWATPVEPVSVEPLSPTGTIGKAAARCSQPTPSARSPSLDVRHFVHEQILRAGFPLSIDGAIATGSARSTIA
jgi:hypothetical protein